MSWHLGPMTAYDCETTGVDVEVDRIVTASIVNVQPGTRPAHATFLADPGVEIPEAATAVHGITTAFAREKGLPPAEVLAAVAADLALTLRRGVPVVGFNVAFDLTILDRECRRHGVPTLDDRLDGRIAPIIDALVLDKRVDRYRRGSRKLNAVCAHYRVTLAGAHEASADALAAARLARRLGEKFAELAAMSLDELHSAQVSWRAEQQASLQDHFRRNGKPDEAVDGSWPLRRLAAEEVAGHA